MSELQEHLDPSVSGNSALSVASQLMSNSSLERTRLWSEDVIARIVLLLPGILVVLLLSIFPLIISLYLSFARVNFVKGGFQVVFVGLQNYSTMFTGADKAHLLGVWGDIPSYGVLAFALIVVLLLSTFVYIRRPGRSIIGYVIPLIGGLPGHIRSLALSFCGVASNFAGLPLALAFISALGRVGVVTQALKSVGIFLYPDFSMSSYWGVCLAYTYFQIPLMVLIMTPALDGLRPEWREAADNLGASRAQYWQLVMLPILLPSLLSALALLFANAFGAYATAATLVGGGAGESLVVSILVRAQFSNDSLTNPHLGYALAFGMIVVIGFDVVIYTWSGQRAERWRRSVK